MILKSLQIKWLKSYEDSWEIPFKELTILIWENDCWKSTALDALEFILTSKIPESAFYRAEGWNIEIAAIFNFDDSDNVEFKENIGIDDFEISKTFSISWGLEKCMVKKVVFSEQRFNNIWALNASDIKDFLDELWIEKWSNLAENKEILEAYLIENKDSLPTVEKCAEIRFNEVSNYLPIIDRYSSNDYGKPLDLIKKSLKSVYRKKFFEDVEWWWEVLKEDYTQLREEIISELEENVQVNLLQKIKIYNPQISELKPDCDIDFTEWLSFDGLQIKDSSSEFKSIENIWEWTKKRIFLSILEWDSDLNTSWSNRKILRLYDEPDANLHYDAQRKMFNVIKNSVDSEDSNIQSVICTHSLSMIDRAPANSIIQVNRDETLNSSTVNYLKSDWDEEIELFLNQVSEISWLKNSSIFFEKCFLVVEGESEENALPKIYKKITWRTLIEDGVVLINMKTNWQWDNVLKFLWKNKQDCVVLLLDSDTQDEWSWKSVTTSKLFQIWYDSSYISSNCFFVWNKEFEDIFSDEEYTSFFNEIYPFESWVWEVADFLNIRSTDKFSDELKKLLFIKSWWIYTDSKPKIFSKLADYFDKDVFESKQILVDLFYKIEVII